MSSSAPGSAQVPNDIRRKPSVDEDLGSENFPEKDDAADEIEVDGQVCDICGDVGYENLLAVCTQCGEGAEHVYCMQKTLEEKPEVWLCEACKKIQRENPSKQAEWQAAQSIVRNLSRSVSMTSSRKAIGPGNARSRIGARLDKKRSGRRAVKGVPGTQTLPMKRPVEEPTVGPSAKRAALEGSIGTGHVKVMEDVPASSIKGPLGDTGSSPGRSSKPSEDSGGSSKVPNAGNADFQSKRPVDDTAAGPAAKRPALGLSAPLSGGFSGRGTLQTGKAAETGKIRFIQPPVSAGVRSGAKSSDSPLLPSPRTSYKLPSQRGSYLAGSALSSETDKPSNAKGSGNLKTGVDSIPSFLLPNKTDMLRKGDISASRNKDGSTKGASQPPIAARQPFTSSARGVTDVSSAIASAKLVKAGRPLSSGSELRTRPESLSRARPQIDGITPPPQKPSKILAKSLPDLSAQKNQVTKVGPVGKGSDQGLSEEKPDTGFSITNKVQEKNLTVEKYIEATGGSVVASARTSNHEDNLPCTLLDDKKPVTNSVDILQSGIVETTTISRRTIDLNGSFDLNSPHEKILDALEMVEHELPARPVDKQGDGGSVMSGGPGKTICLQDKSGRKLSAVTDTSVKVEPCFVVGIPLLKSRSSRELDERDIPSPVVTQDTKEMRAEGPGAMPPSMASRNGTLMSVGTGFPDEGALQDSGTGQRSSKNARPIDTASQGPHLESVPKGGDGTLSAVVNGGDSKKRDRLPMLDLNVAASNTDSDSEDQQPVNIHHAETPTTDLAASANSNGSPTEKITKAKGGILSIAVDLKDHLTGDLPKRVDVPDAVSTKEKQVLGRSLSKAMSQFRAEDALTGLPLRDKVLDHPIAASELHIVGAKTSDSLTRAVAGSSIEMADSSQLPREHAQKASILKSHQSSSTLQDSKSSAWPVDPVQTEMAGLSLSVKPGGAMTGISTVPSRSDSMGRWSSQRPNQRPQPMETAKSPAIPRGIVWRGGFDVVMKEKAMQSFGTMDAYISSKAIARVYDAAKKLPQILQLEEARRGIDSDSWPKHFLKTPPDDASIALYFFASNVESYEKYYKRLLDRMMTHDLVLRGSVVEGAELLVISSHLLPEQYRHQNHRMFMWGVFRAKKSHGASSASTELSSVKQGSTPLLSTTSVDMAIRQMSRPASGNMHSVSDSVAMEIGRPPASASDYPPLPSEPAPDLPPPPPLALS